jgi:hypothetical protein
MKVRLVAAYVVAIAAGLAVSAIGASVPAIVLGAVVVGAVGPAVVHFERPRDAL